jgi:two-component system invasion response regulator UvrY
MADASGGFLRYTGSSLTPIATLLGTMTIRILIADTQPRVRFAMRVLLERQPGFVVIGEATDAPSLLSEVEVGCPDVVLVGWELPGIPLEDLMCQLHVLCPDLLVIALSGRLEAQQAALSCGADAFVSKSSPPEQLLAAIAQCECKPRRAPHG